MSGPDRRQQVLRIAAEEFADGGLHGTSTEVIARRAEITQAYIFRLFGTKKALFLEVMIAAFDRVTEGMRAAAGGETGLEALARMGAQYTELLSDRTSLTIKAFLAFGLLLNNGAALQVADLDEPWAAGARTRIQPGLFDHITTETNR